jgi:hypothetical protein
MCQLQSTFVLHPDTSAAVVASVLVHEAMHARLRCRGFGYEEYQRARIERICCKAQRAFARRLPNSQGAALVDEADKTMAWIGDPALWTDRALLERYLHRLRSAGWPDWAVGGMSTLAKWGGRRRLAAQEAQAAAVASEQKNPCR